MSNYSYGKTISEKILNNDLTGRQGYEHTHLSVNHLTFFFTFFQTFGTETEVFCSLDDYFTTNLRSENHFR